MVKLTPCRFGTGPGRHDWPPQRDAQMFGSVIAALRLLHSRGGDSLDEVALADQEERRRPGSAPRPARCPAREPDDGHREPRSQGSVAEADLAAGHPMSLLMGRTVPGRYSARRVEPSPVPPAHAPGARAAPPGARTVRPERGRARRPTTALGVSGRSGRLPGGSGANDLTTSAGASGLLTTSGPAVSAPPTGDTPILRHRVCCDRSRRKCLRTANDERPENCEREGEP